MVNGSLMIKCGTCGLNLTHGTKHHKAWAKNPTSFKLAANHFYVVEKARLGQGSSAPPTQSPPAPAPAKDTSGTAINSGVISMTRDQLEAKLSTLERNSTNPNASEMSEYLRSLFLN